MYWGFVSSFRIICDVGIDVCSEKYWYHMVPYEQVVSDEDWNEKDMKSEETFKMERYEIPTASISVNGLEQGYQVVMKSETLNIRVTNKDNENKEAIREKLSPTIDVSGLSEGTHKIDLTVNSNYVLSENVKVIVEIKTITKTM